MRPSELPDGQRRGIIRKIRKKCQSSYLDFVRYVFPEHEGYDYTVRWYHRHIANRLEAFVTGTGNRMVISMPPQHGKTTLTSVFLPGWILGKYPDADIIGASHTTDYALGVSRAAKKVIKRRRYRQIFPDTRIPAKRVRTDEREAALNTKTEWEIVGHRGSYVARGAGQAVEGNPADFVIVDDPHKSQESDSSTKLEGVIDWWNQSMSARLRGTGHDNALVIMTRWHHRDLVGWLLKESPKDWEYIRLPALAEEPPSETDPREVGEALWPAHRDAEELKAKKETQPYTFATTWQQRPSQAGGNIVSNEQISRYSESPNLDHCDVYQSWDLRHGGEGDDSSRAVGTLWAVPYDEAVAYLIDVVKGRWSFEETMEIFIDKARNDAMWARARAKLVEDKADGRPLIRTLKRKVSGIVSVDPEGTKISRLESVAPLFSSSSVRIPESGSRSWVEDYVFELTEFPQTQNDDQVDATSQFLDWIADQLDVEPATDDDSGSEPIMTSYDRSLSP